MRLCNSMHCLCCQGFHFFLEISRFRPWKKNTIFSEKDLGELELCKLIYLWWNNLTKAMSVKTIAVTVTPKEINMIFWSATQIYYNTKGKKAKISEKRKKIGNLLYRLKEGRARTITLLRRYFEYSFRVRVSGKSAEVTFYICNLLSIYFLDLFKNFIWSFKFLPWSFKIFTLIF
jgi:hypothetical protein